MDDLIKFLLKSSEKDILIYTAIESALCRHFTSDWVCHRMTDQAIEKYKIMITSLCNQYGLQKLSSYL